MDVVIIPTAILHPGSARLMQDVQIVADYLLLRTRTNINALLVKNHFRLNLLK